MANNIRSGQTRSVLPQLSSPRPNPNARTPQQALQEMTRIMGSSSETYMRDYDAALCPGLFNHFTPNMGSGALYNLGASGGATVTALMRIKQRIPKGFVPRAITGRFGNDAIEHRVGLYEITPFVKDAFSDFRLTYTLMREGAAERVDAFLWYLHLPGMPALDPSKGYALAWRPEWIGAATPYTNARFADPGLGVPVTTGGPVGTSLPASVGLRKDANVVNWSPANASAAGGVPLMQLGGAGAVTGAVYSLADAAWMF